MSEPRCPCWSWSTADAADVEDLIDHGHRRGCAFRERYEVSFELDPDLADEILGTYDDEDSE